MSGRGFEPIRIPSEIWDAHEAELRARDIGAVFRLVKKYAGASQNRIAAATGIPQSRVNALMNNRSGLVSNISVLERISDGLAFPDSARMSLGLAPRAPHRAVARADVLSLNYEHNHAATERAEVRALLAHAAEVTMGVSEPGSEQRWADSADVETPLPSRVSRMDAEQIEDITAALRATDYFHGGGACREAASAQTRWVTRLLAVPAPEDITQRLHLTLADLHNLAGWTSFDVGLHSPARTHYARALVHARTVGQTSLIANILYRTGRLHLEQAMPMEALRFFQLGQIAAQDAGCTMTVAILCANEAWAYACLGDDRQALASLHRAHDELSRTDPASAAPWARFFGEPDLAGLTGLIHLELANTNQTHILHARAALERALTLRGDDHMVRTRTFEQIALATAFLKDGDIDNGVPLGWDAATSASHLQSTRALDRLRPLRTAALAAPNSDAADLADHLEACCQ
ncbi:MAG: helix-turn-helix protein [Actinomycetota bacterium]|nr:helix-turn-helix protein [Actinomycetota bacterium]